MILLGYNLLGKYSISRLIATDSRPAKAIDADAYALRLIIVPVSNIGYDKNYHA